MAVDAVGPDFEADDRLDDILTAIDEARTALTAKEYEEAERILTQILEDEAEPEGE